MVARGSSWIFENTFFHLQVTVRFLFYAPNMPFFMACKIVAMVGIGYF